jgi:hypothetical protein
MKMTNSRFAYSSPLQAGERRTVHHVIGALRNTGAAAPSMIGVGRDDIRHKGAMSYTF